MKVKNIMFSGFAAAVFATVCGAAVAADVSLISKDYADAKLQAKLTGGDGVKIEESKDDDGNVISTTISTDVDLTNLATKSEATYQGEGYVSVNNNKITVTADGEVAEDNTGLVTGGAVHTITSALDTRLGTAEGDIDALQADMGDVPEAGWTISSTNTKNVSEAITLLEGKVADVASTEGLNALEKNVATNTENIALKANSADVYAKTDVYTKAEVNAALEDVRATADAAQTAEEVGSAIDTKISDLKLGETYATVSALDGVKATAEAAQTAEEVGSAIDTKISGLKLGENYQAKLSETQIAAVNSGVDSDKVAAIATNTQGIAENAAEIAKKVSVVTTAGTYLVNFDATGAVSYAPIKIFDKDGNEITLNGESAVKPSAN